MKNTKNILTYIVLIVVFGLSISVDASTTYVWDGGPDGTGTDFNTAENWNPAGIPNGSLGDNAIISLDGANVTMSAPVNVRTLTVSGVGESAPILNITQNIIKWYSPFYVGSDVNHGTGYSGIVNHTSGKVDIGGSGNMRLFIASALPSNNPSAGNTGIYNFGGDQSSAPELFVGNHVIIGHRAGEDGILSLSGYGTFTSGANLQLGMFFGNAEVIVEGGNLDINIGGDIILSNYGGAASSKITAVLGEGGFSTINVAGDVIFGQTGGSNPSTFHLALGDGYVHNEGEVHTIINSGGVFAGHKGFSNVSDGDILSIGFMPFQAGYSVSPSDPNTFNQFSLTALPIDTSVKFNRKNDFIETAKTENYHGTIIDPESKIWEYWVKPFSFDNLEYMPGELEPLIWSSTHPRYELIAPQGWWEYHSVATSEHLNTYWRDGGIDTGKQSWVVATFKNPYSTSVEFEITGETQYEKTLINSGDGQNVGTKCEIAVINSSFTNKQTVWSWAPYYGAIGVYDIPDPELTGEQSITLMPGEYIAIGLRGSRYTYRNEIWHDTGLNITAKPSNFVFLDVQTYPEIIDSGITPGIGSYQVMIGEEVTLAANDFDGICPTALMFSHWKIDGQIYSHDSEITFSPEGDVIAEAVFVESNECGDICRPYPAGDANLDCVVDLKDFAILARDWMECTDPSCY